MTALHAHQEAVAPKPTAVLPPLEPVAMLALIWELG